jgi:hypothetical protein
VTPKIQAFRDVTLCRLGEQVPTVQIIVILSSSESNSPKGVLLDHEEEEDITILQKAGYFIPVGKR